MDRMVVQCLVSIGRILWVTTLILASLQLRTTSAFLAPSSSNPATHPSSSILTILKAIPTINEWRVNRNGSVSGFVQNHPTIPNGDAITTSPLSKVADDIRDNSIVSTKSGSKYKLARRAAPQKQNKPAAAAVAVAPKKQAPTPAPAPPQVTPTSVTKINADLKKYNLNGKTVGDGKYLLSGQKLKSTSIRSEIYYAFKADANGLPKGPRLTVKVSPKLESLSRENDTYNKVAGGLFYRDNFVKKLDYLPDAQGNRGFAKNCGALILESGERTLRALCDARRNQGLEGKAMRQAAVALVQCIQAMQSYGLVWTDLKAENFVVVSDTMGDGSIEGIKAIDLESAVPAGGPPLDYSPEACPPEFAQAVARGEGPDFIVDYEYDSWSYGMLLYELATGRSYWKGKQDTVITRILKEPGFQVDVSAVEDDKLRDLISKCLETNPKRRLRITQILFHPYFLTTGIGPISF